MKKINQLMVKSGLSQEAADKICESLVQKKAAMQESIDKQFKRRAAMAKKVCVEEVEKHKRELSRRIQIFLEAKNVAIEESITRQIAQRDTEAVAKLEKVYALLEGIDVDGQSVIELKNELNKFKSIAAKLVDDRNKAVAKSHRIYAIAESVLNRNRKLEKIVTEGNTTITRRKKKSATKRRSNINEERSRTRAKGARATTTRRTISESVGRKVVNSRQPIDESLPISNISIDTIANAIDG